MSSRGRRLVVVSWLLAPLSVSLLALAPAARADLMIIGNDQKVVWDAESKRSFVAPGKDSVSIVDIADREAPKILVSIPLMNSIFGPPTNLAITRDERLALVANSMSWVQDGAAWKPVPDTQVYVFDLKARPPAHVATVEVGKQPSGMAINRAGDLALVANRNDKSISVLSIRGVEVKLIDTVAMGDEVASVAITPDGKRALATKFPAHKIALLEINGQQVTYTKHDMPVGLWPYNIDAPEGFAISPKGDVAVAVLLGGASAPKSAWFNTKRNGSLAVLKIEGKKVTKVGDVEVGGLPEGVVFSPDGKYLYVGNYVDSDVSILKVDGTKITDTGKKLKLPGQPASMRGPAH
jgi:dipeptidyl aminopeptidase/acylaminoacyl peptidase